MGSIQLCRKPHYTGGWEYFSRLEMYDPLPAGRLASGYIYYTRLGSGPDYLSCDSHVGAIKPGGTLCYSTDVLNDELIVDLRATGRAWYWNGTDWVLYAQGTTAWFD
ncbi:hypothetical protein V1227_05905 [Lentzea sp. DG1S-22]|uniref:hypothetical protein n=1 Tax=Lentzea sp. DG1S-22 TaxID=3108822 RepID=UPI002E79D6C7|nr:hypothetical protein [Lentzea sp. DG1S-22]WVH82293.1 hypothetical protein V1227_05905 [Lentzea sp. DG1S-22]